MLFFLSLSLLIYQVVAIDLSPTLEVKLNVNWTGSTGPSDNIYQITFTDIKSDKKSPVCSMKGVGDVSYPVNLYDDSIELPKTVSSRTSPDSLPGPNAQCDTSSAPPDATKTVTVPLELSATSKSGVIQVNSETTPSEMAYAFSWSYTGLRAAETLVVSNGDTLLLPYVPVSSITARTVFNAVTLAAGASLHVEVHNAASTPIGSRMQFTKADFSRGTLEVEFVDFAPNATQQAQPSLEVRVPGVFQNIDPLSESKLQFDKLTATPPLADWTIAFVVVNSGDLMLTLRKRTATTTPGAATTSERSATSAATTATATASSPSSSDKASDFLIGLSLTLFVAVAGGICCCLVLCVCVIVIVCLVVRGRRRRDNEYRTDTFGLEHNGSNIDFAHVDYDPPSTLGAPPSLSAAPTLHSAVDHSASMVPPPLARDDDGLGSSSSFIPAAIAPDARSAVAYEQPKTITGDDLVLY